MLPVDPRFSKYALLDSDPWPLPFFCAKHPFLVSALCSITEAVEALSETAGAEERGASSHGAKS